MNEEKQVKPHNDQINANIHNLISSKRVKMYFSIINYFPEPPYIVLREQKLLQYLEMQNQTLNMPGSNSTLRHLF